MPTFVILAHRDPQLTARLAERLSPHPVVVHIDKKTQADDFRVALRTVPSVHMVSYASRIAVNWAGFSMLRATMSAFRDAVTVTDPEDHIVLLSGQDYPIKPVSEFADYLKQSVYRQHIRMFEITSDQPKYYRQLVGHFMQDLQLPGALNHPQIRRVALRLIRDSLGRRRRQIPLGTRFTFGSQWIALTGSCGQWLVENFDRSPVVAFTSRSFAPDEKTIHSMVANSPFLSEIPGGRPEPFEGSGTYRLANFHVIDPSLSKIFGYADFERLASSDKFFARKFTVESGALADRIDRDLLHL